MKLCDVIVKIEAKLPLSWAEEWDNPGLNVGDPSSDVSRIAMALDVTEDSVAQAVSGGCQLLVTHHPIIFRAMKSIVLNETAPKAIALAIQKGVALYAAHTNWDSSSEGVNFCLAKTIELSEIEPMLPPAAFSGAWGMGAVGSLNKPISIFEFMKILKERWRLSGFSGYRSGSDMITKVAIGGGSCGEIWPAALGKKADVFITADMPYHYRQEALNMGLNIIVTDHGEMERVSLPSLKNIIEIATGINVDLLDEVKANQILL